MSAGAVLGVRVLRYSGVQGVSLVAASLLQLVTLFVVAHYLGPAGLGRFALLFFAANLLSILLTIVCKPGTLQRTFGESDDDEGSDDEEAISANPKRSLGTGLAMGAALATTGAALGILFRDQIAAGLLGGTEYSSVVIWAVVLGAVTAVFRLTTLILWFERRPGAFLACDLSRPVLTVVVTTVVLVGGGGLEGVLAAAAAATAAAVATGLFLLRGSFEPSLDLPEAGRIASIGFLRSPVILSFWVLNNVDVFILSRFVSDADLGLYTLASRIGFVAAFLPQGFRVAMRPLRKAAIFQAVEDEYGKAVQHGQTLGYFALVCISAVLLMVLAGRVLVAIAPASFGDAAPLIPAAAAALVWPALLRTVHQFTRFPGRSRRTFITIAVLAAAAYCAITFAIAGAIGIYAAPVAMVAALAPACAYLFVRCQRGPNRVAFPVREVLLGLAIATVLGGAYVLVGELPLLAQIPLAGAFGVAYLALLLAFRVVPETHWGALSHMARSLLSGRPDQFRPRQGLRALEPAECRALRRAIAASWAVAATGRGDEMDLTAEEGRYLLRLLRRAGEGGGVPVGRDTKHDGRIGRYVFTDVPTGVRNASLRMLLDAGADAGDLRRLEDLVTHLAAAPGDAWRGGGRGERKRKLGPRRRTPV